MSDEGHGFAQLPISELLDKIAAHQPVPGGGAVAGMVTGLAAALGGMVVAYSLDKESLADEQPMLKDAGKKLAELRSLSIDQAEGDARAYERLNELWSLDKVDPARKAGFNEAVLDAIEAPGNIMRTAGQVLEVLARLSGRSARHLQSDLAIAVELSATGARAAERNVTVNLPFVEDEQHRHQLDETYGALGAQIDQQARETITHLV